MCNLGDTNMKFLQSNLVWHPYHIFQKYSEILLLYLPYSRLGVPRGEEQERGRAGLARSVPTVGAVCIESSRVESPTLTPPLTFEL